MGQVLLSPRLLIGFAIDWSGNPYQLSLINGATYAAKYYDVNQIVFVGGSLYSPIHHDGIRNIIYSHINKNILDGLIVTAACLKRYCREEELEEFLEQFEPLPIVTITEKVKNYPCVRTDNNKGLKELILHLIHDHKYRNFGFIKGTDGNPDAHERFDVFKNTLAEEKIELKPDLIFDGSFSFESGMNAVVELLNKSIGPCDVLVAASDDMARGAISMLQNRGIRVPEEIAVVGYDNQDLCDYLSIPLTTVSQPISEQSWKAMEIIISLIKGKTDIEDVVFPTTMVRRQSCGCTGIRERIYSYGNTTGEKAGEFPELKDIDSFISDLVREFNIDGESDREQIHNILNTLIISIRTENADHFLRETSNMLIVPLSLLHKDYSFNLMFMKIRKFFIDRITTEKQRAFVEFLFTCAALQCSERLERDLKYMQVVEEREIHTLRQSLETFVAILDMDNLANELAAKLPPMGVKSCYLSLYDNDDDDDDDASEVPVLSRLVFAFNENGRIPIFEDQLFPTKNLCPDDILPWQRQFTISVEALFFGQTQLGFCLFEFDKQKQSLWETAQKMFVTVALKAAMYVQKVKHDTLKYDEKVNIRTDALSRANELLTNLYDERKRAEEEVRRLNEELELRVRDRTIQLETAYRRLQDTLTELTATQSKLVQSEKMAALGGLVAGIAHEINTPIGIGVTAASHLERETKDVIDLIGNGSLKKSDLDKYLKVADEASAMILSNLKRAFELIKSFKKIAVDQSSEEKRVFKVKSYFEEIILSLRPKLKKTAHIVKIDCDDEMRIFSFPGAFSQVITNFILNSLIHGFRENEQGKMIIKCSMFRNNFVLRFFDNGRGIKKNYVNRIFEPFFTTNRVGGGTGLGLNLVYNIITQTLGGSIRVMSRPGFGTLFKIIIPYQELAVEKKSDSLIRSEIPNPQ